MNRESFTLNYFEVLALSRIAFRHDSLNLKCYDHFYEVSKCNYHLTPVNVVYEEPGKPSQGEIRSNINASSML